jgi:hypothetical protein
MTHTEYYKNRSCSRPYLLGWRPKICLKTGQKCSKRTSSTGKNRLKVQKPADLGRESSHSSLSTGASSYEMNSILSFKGVKK